MPWLAVVAAIAVAFPAHPGRAADASAPAAPEADGGVVFLMPTDGAFLPGGPVIVAGRLPAGATWANLLLDGAAVPEAVVSGGTFVARLSPVPGRHEVEVRVGEAAYRLAFVYARGGGAARPYRYHRPVLEDRCAECHAGVRAAGPGAEKRTCTGCHRGQAVVYPYVHGPVAAGQCLVCHDPHGSALPALAPATARDLCVGCHDQPSTLQHVEKARSRVCYLCHNPHASMNRRLLYDIVR
jgi:predicted CXXCH cytochrome family protein